MLSSSEKVSNEIYWGKDFDKLISLIRKKKLILGILNFLWAIQVGNINNWRMK